MAETEKSASKGPKMGFSATNLFKKFLRSVGFPVHYSGQDIRTYGTIKDLDRLLNFNAIRDLNAHAIDTERMWDGGKGTGFEHHSLDYYRKEILKMFSEKKGDDLSESIGPFTSKEALDMEGGACENGTGIEDGDENIFLPDNFDLDGKENSIRINLLNGQSFKVKFAKPALLPLIYTDGRAGNPENIAYRVAFFGYDSSEYWDALKAQIKIICDEARKRYTIGIDNPTLKSNIAANVELSRLKTLALVEYLAKITRTFENDHRGKLTGGGGVIKHYNVLEEPISEMKKIFSHLMSDEQVYYAHTFKVISPVIIEKNEKGYPKLVNGKPVMRKLEDEVPNFKREGEAGVGLDENGWPLEVGDGVTKFNGRALRHGEVLIDTYKHNVAPRMVPHEFIVDCDMLDTSVWMYVHIDAYRDDFRDGRHHKGAISVMDRIMTELGAEYVPDIRHPGTMQNILKGKQSKVQITLNDPPVGKPKVVEQTIRPSQWNPAFDLRAIKRNGDWDKWRMRHRGRMYYYDVQDNVEKSIEPTITTRGSAMYILHRVIEEVKYWGGDGKHVGVIETLQEIGEKTNGFDIGPNMGEGESGWGHDLTHNPFKPGR